MVLDAAQLVELGVAARRRSRRRRAPAPRAPPGSRAPAPRRNRRAAPGWRRSRPAASRARCSCRDSCAAFSSEWRRPTSSRGRTWRSAMRAVMRSTSLQPLSSARSVCHGPSRRTVDRFQPLLRLGALAPRLQQPALEHAAAHAGHAGVQQRKQRGRVLAAQRLHQFQVAPRGHRQVDQHVVALHLQALHVRQRAALGVLGVAQQRRRGGVRVHQFFRAPGGQGGAIELLQQLAQAQPGVELPFGPLGERERRRTGAGPSAAARTRA